MKSTIYILCYILCIGLSDCNAQHVFSTSLASTSAIDSSKINFLNWYNASPDSFEIQGASVDKAYAEFLNAKQGKEVIVAVIDGGVDINHEDLNGKIWINKNEISNNGIDDDKNGYVDDIHGWNFLGNSKGENVDFENYEMTRIVRKFKEQFSDVTISKLNEVESKNYNLYRRAKKEYDELKKKYEDEKQKIDLIYKGYIVAVNNVKSFIGKDEISHDDLVFLESKDAMVMRSKKYLLYLDEIGYTKTDLEEIKENNYNHLFFHLNIDFDPRVLIGDDSEKNNGEPYGNNDVMGDIPDHGTFVSGIIAGIRNNNLGINGIVNQVKIMALRVVPDGDERDKDVANAILYAINNGAEIINCSFGKSYSPQQDWVDAALRLADQKGVLVVHAAGNEATNNDDIIRFPTNRLLTGEIIANNFLNVGASSSKANKNLPAKFSNYGKAGVDLFAPGVDIYSLHPKNTYELGNGTSYASPVVSGIAGLLKSYYPFLNAAQVKQLILDSATRYPKMKVYLPDKSSKNKKIVRFKRLSVTGGIINAYEAVKAAEKIKPPQVKLAD